ncbi:MAG: Rpn family recombination-promoting nuclease/putative transposase [Firmicutes bacterium]|nr:Rpn family recombination-promoting nuclease/putative transposase [Bacillota bacterium]
MNKGKELKDLNLLDRFLFDEAMEDKEFLEKVLGIILEKDIDLRHTPQTEKEIRRSTWNRQIKLDVWAMDTEGSVHDAEVQKKNTGNLPKRSRNYQSLIDSRLLMPGEVDFNEMNDVVIILIMPFDLFGKGLYQYTFRMKREEAAGLSLMDGATRIFLNTRGTNREGVSQELVEMLRYFEETTDERAEASGSETIRWMHDKIRSIKSSEEVGIKFMNAWEEKILERQEARAEGLREGILAGQTEEREQGIRKMIELCRELALPPEDTAHKVAEKYRLEQEAINRYIKQYWND